MTVLSRKKLSSHLLFTLSYKFGCFLKRPNHMLITINSGETKEKHDINVFTINCCGKLLKK